MAESLTSLVPPVLVNDFFLSSAALLPRGTGFEGEPKAGARLGPTVYVVSRLVGLQGGTWKKTLGTEITQKVYQ